MRTRIKFILYFLLSFGVFFSGLLLFMNMNYAKNEMAYFREYPYREMARRHQVKEPESLPITPAPEPPQAMTIAALAKAEQPEISSMTPPAQTISIRAASVSEILEHQAQTKPIVLSVTSIPKTPEAPLVVQPAPQAHPQRHIDWRHAANQGYQAYDSGDYATAIIQFGEALAIAPDQQNIRLQLAYAYKISGRNSEAVSGFKAVIDRYDEDPAPFALRREVEQLEDRFQVNANVLYRDETAENRQLAGADLTQSQMALELSYQPENIGFHDGRKFQIYTRILSGFIRDSLTIDRDSFQGGVGLRLKPLSDHNLVFSAERLFKIGDFARSDWMIRAGYSLDYGTDYQEDKSGWWSYSLYLDAALIDPSSPDLYLTSLITTGYNIRMARGLILQPRLAGLISWQKDSFREASLLEAGPGLNMRFHFNDTKYEAYRAYADLTVEYRIKISGNSIGRGGPVVNLMFHF